MVLAGPVPCHCLRPCLARSSPQRTARSFCFSAGHQQERGEDGRSSGSASFYVRGGKRLKPLVREALYNNRMDFDAADQPESVRNIALRYADMEHHFPDTLRGQALPYFIDWLKENVDLVQITAYSDDDAYTIFETMNDQGMSLSPTDMLKGYLLANINDPADKAAANDLW
jgi:Protein of unknown function DUF262